MNLLRSRWSTALAAASLGCLLMCPATARAQLFGELAGGLNYIPTLPTGPIYGSGSNWRASIGWKVASNFSWRIDAFTSQFDSQDNRPLPCPTFGCSPGDYTNFEHANGLIANGLVNLDARGVFYVIGGGGVYAVDNTEVVGANTLHFGVSAGAGIAVPIGSRLRGVVEARWHGLLGDMPAGPTWFAPITVGLRYQP